MTASFPNSIKRFEEIVDFVDDILAEDQNEPNDEITAAEAYLLQASISQPAGGRLSLTTDPANMVDSTGVNTVYYEPYVSDQIGLYISSSSDWAPRTFAGLYLNMTTFSASDNVDIFIYDNSGTPAMAGIKWTNDTTRAAALSRLDGVLVASTDYTRRYVGTVRMTSSTDLEDTYINRLCWNMYNQIPAHITNTICPVNHTYTSTNYREVNNGTSVTRGSLVLGLPQLVYIGGDAMSYSGSGVSSMKIGISVDSVTVPTVDMNAENSQGSYVTDKYALYPIILSAGYHYITFVEAEGSANFQFYYAFNRTLTMK